MLIEKDHLNQPPEILIEASDHIEYTELEDEFNVFLE